MKNTGRSRRQPSARGSSRPRPARAAAVDGAVLELEFPADLSAREIRLYVPAGGVTFATPLLVALDGQRMPDWQLDETLAALARAGECVAPLVVAIPSSAERVEEYGMAERLDYAGRGRKAATFQRFVLECVLPAVRARHGLAAAPERTGIFGASLGGLAAFDLAWRHPEVFEVVGVFSGSLWWRGEDGDAATQQSSRLMHAQVRATAARPPLRCWFQAGTADETDDRDGNGVIDAIQDTTELIDELAAQGFRRDIDVVYREVAGGEHNERTWAQVLPEFLRWALPRY